MSIRKLLIFILVASNILAQENPKTIVFQDLESIIEESSPSFSVIKAQMAQAKIQRDLALQWSNPELNYTREYVENNDLEETEQLLFLSKKFSMPWNYWKEKELWNAEVMAAEFESEQNKRNLLSSVRTAYVISRSLNELYEKQTAIKSSIVELGNIVKAKQDEGAISELESSLISMMIFSLEAEIVSTQKAYFRANKEFKLLLGIDQSTEIILTTPIIFKNVQFEFTPEWLDITNNLGLKASEERSNALKYGTSLEKGNILPDFTLLAGYRQINTDWQGYTLGISLPLPVLNFNGPQIEKQKIKERVQKIENHILKQSLNSDAKILTRNINTTMNLLSKNDEKMFSLSIVENYRTAYTEGTVSLSEFLNAVNISIESFKHYYDMIVDYYETVFELEALTGKQLITFKGRKQ